MKYFLGTVSLVALISSQALATKQLDKARLLADDESSQTALISKLMKSQDYTFDLDENALSSGIVEAVKKLNKSGGIGGKQEPPVAPSTIKFEVQHRICNNLDSAKTSHAPLGNGYYLTKNRHNDLCVESRYNILVYPTKKENREKYNAFYPVTYKSNFLSQPLYEEISRYTKSKGLSQDQTTRLYKYLEPLFYIVKEEMESLLTGLPKSKGWVYTKGYEGTLSAIKRQTDHHLYLTKFAKVAGLDSEEVRTRLLSTLLGTGLSLLPDPHREIHRVQGRMYTLGVNKHGHLSLRHPFADNLPYPVFPEHRGIMGMNVPYAMEETSSLLKQWRRVNEFVDLNNNGLSRSEKPMARVLLQAMGTMFNESLKTFHVRQDQFPDEIESDDLIQQMAHQFVDNHTIPEPYLTYFYRGMVNPDIHAVLAEFRSKGSTHRYLTDDLWTVRLNKDQRESVIDEAFKYLVYQDIRDRFHEFQEYNRHRNERLNRVLNS